MTVKKKNQKKAVKMMLNEKGEFGGSETTDPYENIANAIVIQAAKDYTKALKMQKKRPHYDVAKAQIAELEDFFRSSWYNTLTSVDGEILMRKLNEEVC